MGRNVIVITVEGNQYRVEKNGISDFALIGVLECLISDLKSNRRNLELNPAPKEVSVEEKSESSAEKAIVESPVREEEAILETSVDLNDQKGEISQKQEITQTNEIKNRITNARKAIRDLNGEVEETDLIGMTDEELQLEFDELTAQYKRLKNSQGAAKHPRK